MEANNLSHDFELFTFPNGLRLITVPMEHTQSVTVLVMVATGSRYETPEINGISHFLEHMMFKGTKKRPGTLDITKELDSIGAEYNAFTSKEYTGYYIKCATEKLDTAIDVISDIFQNSKFDEKEVEKEKGVIVEEINMYLDTPQRYIHDVFEGMLYENQPLGFEIAGKKGTIRAFARQNFLDYFETHYFDRNSVIAVAGNIKPQEVKEKIAKYFSGVRRGKDLEFAKAADNQNGPRFKVSFKQTDQTHFILGFPAFDYFSDKAPILEAMSLVLHGGMSSRLFQEFRDKRGLAYYVYAANNPYADAGYFSIGAGVDNARFSEALKIALAECRKLIEEPVSEEELKKIKDYAHGKTLIGLETSDDLASFYADQELLKRELLTPGQKLDLIDKVTASDILKAAKEIFDAKKLNLAVIGSVKQDGPEIMDIFDSWLN